MVNSIFGGSPVMSPLCSMVPRLGIPELRFSPVESNEILLVATFVATETWLSPNKSNIDFKNAYIWHLNLNKSKFKNPYVATCGEWWQSWTLDNADLVLKIREQPRKYMVTGACSSKMGCSFLVVFTSKELELFNDVSPAWGGLLSYATISSWKQKSKFLIIRGRILVRLGTISFPAKLEARCNGKSFRNSFPARTELAPNSFPAWIQIRPWDIRDWDHFGFQDG